jgi:hypothetical protein
MNTDIPPNHSHSAGPSLVGRLWSMISTYQPCELPPHFRRLHMCFIVVQSAVIVTFSSRRLWAHYTGDHSEDQRALTIFLPLITVFVTIQMTLALMHPTRRWLAIIFALLLAFLLAVQTGLIGKSI